MNSILTIITIVILLYFVYLIIKKYFSNYRLNKPTTICVICGTHTNSKQITTCSRKCHNIATSNNDAKLFIKRAKSNIQRQKHLTGYELTFNQWQQTLNYFNNKCAYCHKLIDNSNTHMDHFIPVSNGGTFIFKNIIPSCPECNQSKSKKSPHYFMLSIPLKYKTNINNFIKM